MNIGSWNVNGLRAVAKSGFAQWVEEQKFDLLGLQEIKVLKDQLIGTEHENLVHLSGLHSFWNSAEKKGYSGVCVYSKKDPENVIHGMPSSESNNEGRVLTLEFRDFYFVNAYFPNSQRDHARLPYKLMFCQEMKNWTDELKSRGKMVILCGDFNIAHQEIDLKNPKSNQNNAGFLPEERDWMSSYLESGYVDTFRYRNSAPGHYTWWSYRPGVREKNIGWRLDYFVTDSENQDRIGEVTHQTQVYGSDHCPVQLKLRT